MSDGGQRPRYVFGTAYNALIGGLHHSKRTKRTTFPFEVRAALEKYQTGKTLSSDDRLALYMTSDVALDPTKDNTSLVNIPLMVEHMDRPVGTIGQSVTNKNAIDIYGEIWDPEAIKLVDNKTLQYFSIGYDCLEDPQTPGRFIKHIKEVSLVKEPIFDGCGITVTASKSVLESNKKSILQKVLRKQPLLWPIPVSVTATKKLETMSTQQSQQGQGPGTPAVPPPPQQSNNMNQPPPATTTPTTTPTPTPNQQALNDTTTTSMDTSVDINNPESWKSLLTITSQSREEAKQAKEAVKAAQAEIARYRAWEKKNNAEKQEKGKNDVNNALYASSYWDPQDTDAMTEGSDGGGEGGAEKDPLELINKSFTPEEQAAGLKAWIAEDDGINPAPTPEQSLLKKLLAKNTTNFQTIHSLVKNAGTQQQQQQEPQQQSQPPQQQQQPLPKATTTNGQVADVYKPRPVPTKQDQNMLQYVDNYTKQQQQQQARTAPPPSTTAPAENSSNKKRKAEETLQQQQQKWHPTLAGLIPPQVKASKQGGDDTHAPPNPNIPNKGDGYDHLDSMMALRMRMKQNAAGHVPITPAHFKLMKA